ncbi:uracil-DNA glycosylase [Roseateles sp. PN1]|uniref:uracil-DNA glycosylase n=1 Tax=Roseateles sp. PN1 TaxID=3137372 RepID=UPI003139E196
MTWDERQRAMLAAMGLRVWPRAEALADADETVAAQAEPHAEAVDDPAPARGVERDTRAAPAPSSRPSAPAVAAVQALPAALRGEPAPTASPSGTAPLIDAAALDWAGLQAAAEACRACALGEGGAKLFGQGQAPGLMPKVRCLVVVDAAAELGDGDGQSPLSGEAGTLLANLLRAMGLNLAQAADGADPADARPLAFVTSPLKCRPQAGKSAAAAELQRCQPLLARQIELLAPQLILALGPLSIQALLSTPEPLGRLRGRVHSYRNIPVVVSYHPAYLLRQQADKPRAWADLCLALASLEGQS